MITTRALERRATGRQAWSKALDPGRFHPAFKSGRGYPACDSADFGFPHKLILASASSTKSRPNRAPTQHVGKAGDLDS
jgi:hypothetical protein